MLYREALNYLIKVLIAAFALAALPHCGKDDVRIVGQGCVKGDGTPGTQYTDGSCR